MVRPGDELLVRVGESFVVEVGGDDGERDVGAETAGGGVVVVAPGVVPTRNWLGSIV